MVSDILDHFCTAVSHIQVKQQSAGRKDKAYPILDNNCETTGLLPVQSRQRKKHVHKKRQLPKRRLRLLSWFSSFTTTEVMATTIQFDVLAHFIRVAKSVEFTPKTSGKGSSGVSTRAGEQIWMSFNAAEMGDGSRKRQSSVYVKRGANYEKVTLGHIDYDTVVVEVHDEQRRVFGKHTRPFTPRSLPEFVLPVWLSQGWVPGKASEVRARRHGAQPDLHHTRDSRVSKTTPRKQLRNNRLDLSFKNDLDLIERFKNNTLFPDDDYEDLQAAIQVTESIQQQPPISLLRALKTWSQRSGRQPFEGVAYMKWRAAQKPLENVEDREEEAGERKEEDRECKEDGGERREDDGERNEEIGERESEREFRLEDVTIEDWRRIWEKEYRIQTGRDVTNGGSVASARLGS
ncbi:hypothetical protein C7974DRAFT_443064 [Boeremia exigua]|uniref:uncharacterized protein n=1 Tax=Boeremia exigua TaxID=749465 RepID=UPI001E8ED27D|nr:uncharacterized protein C7974DRAFT_443064 [Boeremia exigua]KAH6614996.1 hypothetical protein C7974DRAFT_443064 [Boeremia exigua]